MKKSLIVLLGLLILAGCETKKEKLTIEDDDSRVYLPVAQIDSIPKLISPENSKELSDEFASVFDKYSGELKDNQYAMAAYTIYIDENGVIQKVKRTPGKMMWANQSEETLNDIESKLTDIFGKMKFTPAINNGNPHKYRTGFMISAAVQDSKAVCSLYADIAGLKTGQMKQSVPETSDKSAAALADPSGYFVVVEQTPEPIGGMEGIAANVKYPEIAKRAGIEGRVFVRAYVDENGDVVKTDIIKGIGAGCDEAAINAVMKTKFKPGIQKGKPVKVQVAIPIVFKLQ